MVWRSTVSNVAICLTAPSALAMAREWRDMAARAASQLTRCGLWGQPASPEAPSCGRRTRYTQRSLVEVLLPDADKLWDPTLPRIDALLDDEVLIDRIADAPAHRHPQSRRDTGGRGDCACWSSSISTTGVPSRS